MNHLRKPGVVFASKFRPIDSVQYLFQVSVCSSSSGFSLNPFSRSPSHRNASHIVVNKQQLSLHKRKTGLESIAAGEWIKLLHISKAVVNTLMEFSRLEQQKH